MSAWLSNLYRYGFLVAREIDGTALVRKSARDENGGAFVEQHRQARDDPIRHVAAQTSAEREVDRARDVASRSRLTQSARPSRDSRAAPWRPRISGPALVTTGRPHANASTRELQPDQPMLSSASRRRPWRPGNRPRKAREDAASAARVEAAFGEGGCESLLKPRRQFVAAGKLLIDCRGLPP